MTIASKPATEDYRVGWDRVFGRTVVPAHEIPQELVMIAPGGYGFVPANAYKGDVSRIGKIP